MWLLEPSALERMKAIEVASLNINAEMLEAASDSPRSRLLSVRGNVAEIKISGVLTNEPDFFAMLFGGGNTTYKGIISAIAEAEADDDVRQIDLRIDDSPGGNVSGMFAAASAIATTTKPTRAIVDNLAASATYLLASQADELIATNEGARFGSVGVVSTHFTDDSVVEIASSKAPNKRPDVRTEEGKAAVREHLDQIHGLLASTIARGRSVTERTVNSKFGKGGVMIAAEALKADMIDGIGTVASVNNGNTATGGKQKEVVSMDLNELKMKHPDVYAAAVREGVDNERDRVKAHLTYGE
ncbi:MAG: S49 family peptidase, partial [Planctomycetota bacterium]